MKILDIAKNRKPHSNYILGKNKLGGRNKNVLLTNRGDVKLS